MTQYIGILVLTLVGVMAALGARRLVRARLARWRRDVERIRVEDALKHLYEAEYRGRVGSLESVAGALAIPRRAAVRLVVRVDRLGLAEERGDGLRLTADGREYALRVIRSHRLWEHHLAEETGLQPAAWHTQAEAREHTLTEEEADALSARLGHPRYDPHGDPIPTRAGDLPPLTGTTLTTLEAGEAGRIVHLEDEPPELYATLTSAGLAPGMGIEVVSPENGEVRVVAGGREHALERAAASLVTVERLGEAERPEPGLSTLADVAAGGVAEVVRISAACRGAQRRRLLDLGVVPGTRITATLRSASGDPVAYTVRGALVALRREQAERILVRHVPAGDASPGAADDARRGVAAEAV